MTQILCAPHLRPSNSSGPFGAILGDYVGSRFERHNITTPAFEWRSPRCKLTDDSVLTAATCEVLLGELDYRAAYRRMVRRFPRAGFGLGFKIWATGSELLGAPRSSSCGAAIRVSPIGWALDDLDDVCAEAERSALSTHDHPDAVAGAQAIAGAVALLRQGASVETACAHAASVGIPLDRDIAAWRAARRWSSQVRATVPVAFAALREGHDVESVIRLAISAGGDSDSIASMAGALAEARWGIPEPLLGDVRAALARAPSLLETLRAFHETFRPSPPHTDSRSTS